MEAQVEISAHQAAEAGSWPPGQVRSGTFSVAIFGKLTAACNTDTARTKPRISRPLLLCRTCHSVVRYIQRMMIDLGNQGDPLSHAFGEFFGRLRRERLRRSLRQFYARKGLDPGNMSRLERGKILPPRGRKVLEKYARALELKKGSDDWYTFFDLAAVFRGELPKDLAADDEVLERLPVLFRSLRGDRIDDEKLDDLIDLIRNA